MNTFNPVRRALLRASVLAASVIAAPLAHADALPADSLYRLSVPLKDSQGRQFDWRALAGRPLLVTMFYGDCNAACPIIIENLRRTVDAVKPAPGRLAVLMVSLDPLYDTPGSLADLAKSHKLDPAIFRLAVAANETHTRAMAGALQIKYRAVTNGEINHTTRVCLLDAGGKPLASSTQLSPLPDPAFVAKIRLAVK
ncbi:SCO family protein [Massilia violaceinigra]|uniref:SCO family protein n=1 Tax=Massilia violaceinigra TaxID=2045208 RepID=A0ABY4A3Y4_9BURK|nr:SCO family protein [Massilia violaceinigra]UOD29431.1 SCO family protein [Massilia violaceinigra]